VEEIADLGALFCFGESGFSPIQIAMLAVSGSSGHNHRAIRRRFCAVRQKKFVVRTVRPT